MNINAIKARREAVRRLERSTVPFSAGLGLTVPEREFHDHAGQDIDDLLAVLDPLMPYLHHDMPVEDLAGAVKLMRENHERAPFITEDWARERQDREFYEGLLAECAKTLAPLAEHDPALRDLAGRLLLVLADEDDLCETCGQSDTAHTFAELLACCGSVDALVRRADDTLERLRAGVVE